ncbi:39590_t:CDS:1, partial [Gigaspora margarita]
DQYLQNLEPLMNDQTDIDIEGFTIVSYKKSTTKKKGGSHKNQQQERKEVHTIGKILQDPLLIGIRRGE